MEPKITNNEAKAQAKDAARMLSPLKSRTRDQEVLNALVNMIEAAGLTVGDRLPTEKELASRLGVGRSSIREAMKAWQSMGIVTRNKSAGTILAAEISSNSIHVPITIKLEAESLLRTNAVRRPLEIEVTRLAALNATDEDKTSITSKADALMLVHESGEDWRPADADFHAAIHHAAGNPLFGQLIHKLHAVFHDIYQTPFGNQLLGASSLPLHKDLAKAIANSDPEKAVQIMIDISDLVEFEVRKEIDGEKTAKK